MANFKLDLNRAQGSYGQLAGVILASVIMLAMPLSATAQEAGAALLPGGATSLQETHGDWSVQCEVRQVSKADPVRTCVLSQRQNNNQGQMVLSIQLQPEDTGARGVLILPFGLAVSQSVTLQVDELEPESPIPFTTCVPAGCFVQVSHDADFLARMSSGSELRVTAQSSQGQKAVFSISLRGFTAALNRTQVLLQ